MISANTVKMRNELKQLNLNYPIAIVGMGLTGESILRLLLAAGISRDQIFTFDQKAPADFSQSDDLIQKKVRTICLSPGISLKTPWIQDLKTNGCQITSELEIAFSFLTNERVVAITGSVGKSTTTALLGVGARFEDKNSFAGGNLGFPLADYVTGLLAGKPRAKFILLELSSYQLETFKNLKAEIGVITYLSPNHLERYASLEEYYNAKISMLAKCKRVVANQNGGDNRSKLTSSEIIWTEGQSDSFQKRLSRTPELIGLHNLDNLAVAFKVASLLGWDKKANEEMLSFRGLPHRMENLGWSSSSDGNKILFINDSKGTTMDSVIEAVRSIQDQVVGDLHILLGGKDKNLPWEQLSQLKSSKFIFHFFGQCASVVETKSGLTGNNYSTLKACLDSLPKLLKNNDVVLLSPGGTSLDEFKNFEDRGNFFKNWVLAKFHHS